MAQRLSQLASELWPFLLPKVGAMVQGAGGGGGVSGGGTIGLHDLSGSLHKGTLADAQAPQFLLRSGARSLTGDLAVDAGVTIDGVDIGAHAVDPNAHHAKLHAITDAANHSVTGAQYQIVGLTAVNTLGLLTPSATPAANAVVKTDGSSAVTLVDLTVTSDLFMTGYLDFGTDVMHEDASYLQVTGAKPVRFGQNIGNANWTIYNAGGASFGGSVDITGTGDLYVAGSLGGAGGVLKTSGNRVGIACVPDSQFALDVAGPARAQYWIGPHALQVDDAIMICHYDGFRPYNSNYTGIVLGHMGQVGIVTNAVVFRPGKFGKAVQVSESGYNYCPNPSVEVDATGWTQEYNGGTLTGQTRSTEQACYGTYSVKMTASAASTYVYNQPHFHAPASTVAWNVGTTATLSCFVRGSGTWRIVFEDAGQNLNAYQQVTLAATDDWRRVVITATNAGANQASVRLSFFPWSSNCTLYVDGVQYEQTVRASAYLDGSLSAAPGHGWYGTAHASASYRNGGTLAYTLPSIAFDSPVTLMAWVNMDGIGAKNYSYLWSASTDYYSAYINSANTLMAGNVNCGTMPSGWVHIALTTDGGGTVTAYVNGASKGTAAISRSSLTAIYVGSQSTVLQCNGLIDDFAIIGRALPANEVLSIYNSDAPIFAETATVSWVATPGGLVWADERGLWMRDTAGNPVLGVYGGEAATYSWGGFTMASGDLVLGRNAVGSSAILWDQSAGTFGFYGAGSGTPQVEIATDGRLTAGAGKVKLDSAGFHALNASLVATIDIDANGISTGDGGARTTIAAWTSGSRIKWYSVGEIYAATLESYLDDSSISRNLYPLVVRAVRQGNDAALIELAAVRSDTGAGAKIIIGEGFRLKGYFSGSGNAYATNRVVHALADDVILESTNLQLYGQTTSTSAVGTYAGKIKIRINGTDRYIPYYAS